jgi:hypothetical protein
VFFGFCEHHRTLWGEGEIIHKEGNSITMKLIKVYSGEQVISQPTKKTPCD